MDGQQQTDRSACDSAGRQGWLGIDRHILCSAKAGLACLAVGTSGGGCSDEGRSQQ